MSYRLTKEQIATVVAKGSNALAEYCQSQGLHYVVTGSSGGLDSAVILGIAQKACKIAAQRGFKLTSVALILPCQTCKEDTLRGREVAQKFEAQIIELELDETFSFLMMWPIEKINDQIIRLLKNNEDSLFLDELSWSKKIAQGNIKARLRMMLGTYHVARMLKGMVLSTDNLSEFWMAFWTICGDVGDFSIIQQVLKGFELYDIARYLEVPASIINAKPDDGLGISNGDADQLGAEYPVVDQVMISLIQKGFNPNGCFNQLNKLSEVEGVDQAIVAGLAKRALLGAYKRQGPIVLSREQLGLPSIQEVKL